MATCTMRGGRTPQTLGLRPMLSSPSDLRAGPILYNKYIFIYLFIYLFINSVQITCTLSCLAIGASITIYFTIFIISLTILYLLLSGIAVLMCIYLMLTLM